MLEKIRKPEELKALSEAELSALAQEIRDFLVREVSKTGGHLGPNLGVVELTIALHRSFQSPQDALIFDTGHQSYVHKLLTGRQDFSRLRQSGGLSGYPSRAESVHDVLESSHASVALSWADGIARGFALRGKMRHTVAIIGDGALTGGVAMEALNNIAADNNRVIIVVNDNGLSYGKTKGGIAGLRCPEDYFAQLGIAYLGKVDGHSIADLERAFEFAKAQSGAVVVHVATEKGRGMAHFAGEDAHSIASAAHQGRQWTDVFGAEIAQLADRNTQIVGITAAMQNAVGFGEFAAKYPDRVFDVGIAEQHAVVSAAGLAYAGMHPVVAIYATFMNRAFDQVLFDAGLHKAGVTFVLDRAGVTGPDGATHHGIWDLALFQMVPGIRIAAPRDAVTLRESLREAVGVDDAPTVVRYPRGECVESVPAVWRAQDGVDVLLASDDPEVLIIAIGAFAQLGLDVAHELSKTNVSATVVDPRWVIPVPASIAEFAGKTRQVITLEDGVVEGGVGSRIAQYLTEQNISVPVHNYGLPTSFIKHATRAEILTAHGLTAEDIAQKIMRDLA